MTRRDEHPPPAVIRTRFTTAFGIDAPVVSAPISAAPELAAAVSNAGGLGQLQITWLDDAAIQAAIRATRNLTDRPFGVNLVLDEPRGHQLDVALNEGVAVVTLFWGDPAPYVEQIHAAGALATVTVASAAEARHAASVGIDAVVAQGWEAGGHVWGDVATLPLVPAVRAAVGSLPVLAAGGIADGHGLAAVLALGADGAWIGTRLVASREAPFAREYKMRIVAASETDATYTTLFDIGWPDAPHRVLRNSTVAEWEAAGRPPSGHRPGEGETLATRPDGKPIRRYSIEEPNIGMTGNLEALALYAGQSAGLVPGIEPAGTIVRRLVEQAESVIRGLASATH